MQHKYTRVKELVEDVAKLDIKPVEKLYLVFKDTEFIVSGVYPSDQQMINYLNITPPTLRSIKKSLKQKNMI